MSFEKITKSYLREFQQVVAHALRSGSRSIELATRPVVHNYISAVAEHCVKDGSQIIIHHDTNYTKSDRPDWRLEDQATFGIFCFGDHKSLSPNGQFNPSLSEQKQISRYLALGRPVFVFDGIEFIFYKDDLTSPRRYLLIPKPLDPSSEWEKITIDVSVEAQFRTLLENPGFRKWTETQLVHQLANRARMAADEIAQLLGAPAGSGQSESEEKLLHALQLLRDNIAEHHDPSLRDEQSCANFVAQVLTFGLFYAHTRHTKSLTNPAERQEAIKNFWSIEGIGADPSLLRPFKAIVLALSDSLNEENVISDWYSEILALLAHAEYMGTETGPRDFHSLFEQFLTSFDEKARFDRGAFYTPSPLTKWIVSATDSVSNEMFGLPIMEAAEKVIDPCCGTGGFLESVYAARVNPKAKSPTLVGFEILPAPYALAHYRLAELLDGDPNPPALKIILTDTLADQLLEAGKDGGDGFEEELKDAISLSKPPIRLVIGNPPSSNHAASSAARTSIEAKLEAFRPPRSERTDRQNIQKALNNEAYRFLRWCADKALESGRGILALVLPGAFARSVSFQYARKWILENFQKIYILEIDADARRGDATQSVFSVLQGRLVIIASRDKDVDTGCAEIFHRDISAMSLEGKISFLESPPTLSRFSRIAPTAPQWSYAPTAHYPEDLWLKGWPLTSTSSNAGIFLQKCSAIKLGMTAALFHTQRPILIRRTLELSRPALSVDILWDRWFSGQAKSPNKNKLTTELRSALKKAVDNDEMVPYLYRPFVSGYVLNSEPVFKALNRVSGGGLRHRPEVRAAFSAGAIGIAVAPAPSDLGSTLTRFTCFSWNLPDNDIASRGNAMIYCDIFPDSSTRDRSVMIENTHADVSALFSFSPSPSRAALFYTYAMLSSPTYLDKFEGVLYAPANPSSPPRILISSEEEIRKKLVELGTKISECEKADYIPSSLESLSDSWPTDLSEFKLVNWIYDDSTEELKLIGDSNEQIVISKVPQQVIALRISGHSVIDKWLRERQFSYLTRKFTKSDAAEAKVLIGKILDQLALIETADKVVVKIFETENVIPPTLIS